MGSRSGGGPRGWWGSRGDGGLRVMGVKGWWGSRGGRGLGGGRVRGSGGQGWWGLGVVGV